MSNKNKLYYLKNNGSNIPEFYFEMTDIDFFDIKNIHYNKSKILKNFNNKKCKIRERTFDCIINGLENNKF